MSSNPHRTKDKNRTTLSGESLLKLVMYSRVGPVNFLLEFYEVSLFLLGNKSKKQRSLLFEPHFSGWLYKAHLSAK